MRFLLVIILALALLGAGIWMEYRDFVESPLTLPEEPLILDVPRGTSMRTLSKQLAARGVLDQPYFLLALAYLTATASRIKAGEYEVPRGTTPAGLLDLLISGRVVQRAVTLVEGWSFNQALAALIQDDRLRNELENPTPEAVMERLGQRGQHPEGRFFPDTYHFTRGSSDLDILRRSYARMSQVLNAEWEQRDEGLPLATPDEALILASIVEKETGLASERPAIAGIFIRRLELGMKLQTDPTLIYGLGEAFDGDLKRSDLQRDTPYNTYLHGGLPPTPIALPGRAAIRAVLHPLAEDSLYFVAKGDGSHHFSATLDEHNQAVRRYQLRQ